MMSKLPPIPRLPSTAKQPKRRMVDVNLGDRYCSHCGQPIYGQTMEGIGVCPHGGCKKVLPFLEKGRKKFEGGWDRCVGFGCAAFIEKTMLFCQLCAAPNQVAFETKERREKAERLSAEAKQKETIKKIMAEQQRLQDLLKEKEEIIKAQEEEIMENRLLNIDDKAMEVGDGKANDSSAL